MNLLQLKFNVNSAQAAKRSPRLLLTFCSSALPMLHCAAAVSKLLLQMLNKTPKQRLGVR
jgi:hypothetical protein